jgi:hypothetical protein
VRTAWLSRGMTLLLSLIEPTAVHSHVRFYHGHDAVVNCTGLAQIWPYLGCAPVGRVALAGSQTANPRITHLGGDHPIERCRPNLDPDADPSASAEDFQEINVVAGKLIGVI